MVFEGEKPDKGTLLGKAELSLSDIMREANQGKIGPRWFELQDKDGQQTGSGLCMQLNVQLLASATRKCVLPHPFTSFCSFSHGNVTRADERPRLTVKILK